MKRVTLLSLICLVAFFGWHYTTHKTPETTQQAQSSLTLWDIGLIPSIPPKEHTTPLVVSKSENGDTLEDLSPTPNKPFLIHFWAPWCSPCRAELPHFAKFVAEHPEVQIWCVADSAQTPQNIQSFYEGQKISELPIMIDTGDKLTHRLGIEGLPTTIFFDAKGREKGRIVGAIHWINKGVVDLIVKELLS